MPYSSLTATGSSQPFATARFAERNGRIAASRSGRFRRSLLLTKFIATLLAVYVYGAFVPFSDAERYLGAAFSPSLDALTDRTAFTDNLYAAIKLVLIKDILVHLTASLAVAWIIWRVFRRSYAFLNETTFWACLLLPHFLIWSGVVAKEPIAIVGGLLVVKGCVDIAVYGRTNVAILTIGVALAVLMRQHYAIAYCFLLATTVFFVKFRPLFSGRASLSHWLSGGLACGLVVLIALWATYETWAGEFFDTMEVARDYFFLYDANSNRYQIEWKSASDYFRDIWWGVPISIIGPTLSESIERTSFLPVFIEGVFSLFLIIYLAVALIRFSARNAKYRPIVCFGFMPALALALAAHYLLGVFNPGSAIRYKQSLAPLFYFYPILLLAEAKRKTFLSRSNIQQGD